MKSSAIVNSPSPTAEPLPFNSGPLLAKTAYPWSSNSCWLDSSLQIFFIAINRNFQDYSEGIQDTPKTLGLKSLYSMFDKRRISEIQDSEKTLSTSRRKERDSFRKLLKKKEAIRSIDEPESLLVTFKLSSRPCSES